MSGFPGIIYLEEEFIPGEMVTIHLHHDIEEYGFQVNMYKPAEVTCIKEGTGEDKI
jgi:hypothetical protein